MDIDVQLVEIHNELRSRIDSQFAELRSAMSRQLDHLFQSLSDTLERMIFQHVAGEMGKREPLERDQSRKEMVNDQEMVNLELSRLSHRLSSLEEVIQTIKHIGESRANRRTEQ